MGRQSCRRDRTTPPGEAVMGQVGKSEDDRWQERAQEADPKGMDPFVP